MTQFFLFSPDLFGSTKEGNCAVLFASVPPRALLFHGFFFFFFNSTLFYAFSFISMTLRGDAFQLSAIVTQIPLLRCVSCALPTLFRKGCISKTGSNFQKADPVAIFSFARQFPFLILRRCPLRNQIVLHRCTFYMFLVGPPRHVLCPP